MNPLRRLRSAACRTGPGRLLVTHRRFRMILFAFASLMVNLLYALYHGILGLMGRSWWFLAMFAYYAVLGATRFAVVLCGRKSRTVPSPDLEWFVLRVCGMLLTALSIVLAGVNYMGLSGERANRYGTITMITIAAYTFTKLTLAILRAVKQRREPSPLMGTIRCIGYAEVAVSILTLQRSMLVSFAGMTAGNILLMNALTGGGVFLFIAVLGISMMIKGVRQREQNNAADRKDRDRRL